MDYLKDLNPEQRKAAEKIEGPVMVLAGPGSGKTKTIVARIIHIIKSKNIQPWQILAVTFSNRAANEMKERVHKLMPDIPESALSISTFHAFCAKLLRFHGAGPLKLKNNFSIYDESEALAVAKEILRRNEIDPKKTPASALCHYIDMVKNEGFYVGRKNFKLKKELKEDKLYPLFIQYEQELANNNAVDFGGLLTRSLELLEEFPDIKQYYLNKYLYIMVDEYQDTNRAQFDLMKLLTNPTSQNVCVVGDEDQSVYSWRGAEIKNILDFEKAFTNVEFLRLEQNYRSTQNIVKAASEVVKRNTFRKGKNLWTQNPEGDKIKVYECSDGNKESLFVAQSISDLLRKKVPAKEIAVFYRTNAQSRTIEDACRRFMIPYQVIGGLKFYERKEVKDLIAYMQLIMNPQDNISLLRVINTPARGLGDKTLEKLVDSSREEMLSVWEYLIKYKNNPKMLGSPKAVAGILDFISIIESGMKFVNLGRKISELYDDLLDKTHYLEILKASKKYEDQARIENLQELKTSIMQFESAEAGLTLQNYLETITLDRTAEADPLGGKVSLMTIHASKGLEFDNVFIIGCEETIFPSPQSLSEGLERSEEERRLFYVAITRARKQLSILHSLSRMIYGKVSYNPPSRYILELPREYIQKFRV